MRDRPDGWEFFDAHRLSDVTGFARKSPEAYARLPLHEALRRLRLLAGLRQGQLAAKAGVAQAYLCRLEKGRMDAKLSTLRRVFAALDCELMVLPRPLREPDRAAEADAREMTALLRGMREWERGAGSSQAPPD